MRHAIARWFYDRPVTVLMAFLACMVLGCISWTQIPLQMMPSGFQTSSLWVWVPYRDGSPQEIDESIIRPLEAQLSTVPGIKTLRSTARTSSAGMHVTFHGSVDVAEGYNAVVDRIERALPDLPDDIGRYGIYRFSPDDAPILWAGVNLPPETVDPFHVLMRQVKPRLERVVGVASVDFYGIPKHLVSVDYDRDALVAHSLSLNDLHGRLSTDNFEMGSGQIIDDGLVHHVRGLSQIEDLETIRKYPVRDGVVLDDVAKVLSGGVLSADIRRINGEKSYFLVVQKESAANTVGVNDGLNAAFDKMEKDAGFGGVGFFPFFSQGELISESVQTLTETALLGGLFAVIILWSFLREWKMTALISASIPFSLLVTIGLLHFQGQSLNLLSLMGLMLAVGMVVDNAIVVVETIYRRRANGDETRDAAIEGTAEVNLAIILSTLTSMVVFLPVMLMSDDGKASFFLGALGFPVVFALGTSLVVALVFAPLATRFMGTTQIKADPRWLQWLNNKYQVLLKWVINYRVDFSALIVGLLFLTGAVAIPGVQCVSSSEGNLNNFEVGFSVPARTTQAERDLIVSRFEEVLETHKEAWGIRAYRASLGGNSRWGNITVYLQTDPPIPREEVIRQARKVMPNDLPGVDWWIGWGGSGDDNSNQMRLRIYGEEMDVLHSLGEEVVRRVKTVDQVITAQQEVDEEGRDEIQVIPDRESLVRYGVSAADVAVTLARGLRVAELPSLWDDEREIEVQSRFELEDRENLETMLDYLVYSPTTQQVLPVRALSSVEYSKGPRHIRRHNRRTSIQVTVDLSEEASMYEVMPSIERALESMVLPLGYTISAGREFQQQQDEDDALKWALLLSVVFVFLLMGVLFESFLHPFAIIATIPLAILGAFWGLYITGSSMDTMAGVGLIILVGIVVNNGIVLVDLIHQLRLSGVDRAQAILDAGARRFRPILMTALTTIVGLIPMAMGQSTFIGIPYAPLGRTVIGGLTAATVLTLFVVPFLYVVLDDFRSGLWRYLAYIRDTRRS